MLLTKKFHTNVPLFFQSKMDHLSHYLQTMIELYAGNDNIESVSEEFCECISEFYAAIKINNLTYATRIIEQFYTRWIESSRLPDKLNSILEQVITSAITTLIMFHLATQLAYISHYSFATSCNLTLLYIMVGIKIITPEWSSVGTLSGGMFKCSIFKSCAPMRNTYRNFKV